MDLMVILSNHMGTITSKLCPSQDPLSLNFAVWWKPSNVQLSPCPSPNTDQVVVSEAVTYHEAIAPIETLNLIFKMTQKYRDKQNNIQSGYFAYSQFITD